MMGATAGTAMAAGSANGLTAYTTGLLMWFLNWRYQFTFPPEVAVDFMGFVGFFLTLLFHRLGINPDGVTFNPVPVLKASIVLLVAFGGLALASTYV